MNNLLLNPKWISDEDLDNLLDGIMHRSRIENYI